MLKRFIPLLQRDDLTCTPFSKRDREDGLNPAFLSEKKAENNDG
jgi:hypothetical protein